MSRAVSAAEPNRDEARTRKRDPCRDRQERDTDTLLRTPCPVAAL